MASIANEKGGNHLALPIRSSRPSQNDGTADEPMRLLGTNVSFTRGNRPPIQPDFIHAFFMLPSDDKSMQAYFWKA